MTTVQSGTRMTFSEYMNLDEMDGGKCELINGEFFQMPAPTAEHQLLIDFLVRMINNWAHAFEPIPGLAFTTIGLALSELYAPTPDIVYLRAENLHLIRGGMVEGAPDLVVEALSSDRSRDLVMKRTVYAEAGIPEYWILDPLTDTIRVLELMEGEYVERAVLGRGDILTTATIPGFELELDQLFGDPVLTLIRDNS